MIGASPWALRQEGADLCEGILPKERHDLALQASHDQLLGEYGSERCCTASCGGLRIDTGAYVIDLDGNVVPGLYAAGRNAGTIYGWYMGSSSYMADVLTFGRIVGQNAAAE